MPINKLVLGDNLEILKSLESESADLVYLDPLFFSNRSYEVIWGDTGEIRSFQDRWAGSIDHYIAWLYDAIFFYGKSDKSWINYIKVDWDRENRIKMLRRKIHKDKDNREWGSGEGVAA